MNWIIVLEIGYIAVLIAVCARIIYDTSSTVKTLAYLLLAIFIPVAGMLFYFSFGINYRKRQLYSKKLIDDDELWEKIRLRLYDTSRETFYSISEPLRPNKQLAKYLSKEMSPLTRGNEVNLLVNGEEKFPAVLTALEAAKDHIHIAYYIYENDEIGQRIEEILIRKSREGVAVRFMYDDFGSRGIRKNIARRLRAAGVHTFPFYKIVFIGLANHLNYRNHRKIIVIDGKVGFVGGINISDRYINKQEMSEQIFWRDTHLMLQGPAVGYLQYLFLCDWNFASGRSLADISPYFPEFPNAAQPGDKLVQFAASGPDSINPTILYSLLYAIHDAQDEILITTPYFIPERSIMDAILVAALGGVSVKMLVPEKSDSKLVELAAYSYCDELLAAGVKVYLYRKGFVHAKTVVVDKKMAIVGTANMDFRSFDLNFEVNAIIYDDELANSLVKVFEDDIKDAVLLVESEWSNRSILRKFLERLARLVSPLL